MRRANAWPIAGRIGFQALEHLLDHLSHPLVGLQAPGRWPPATSRPARRAAIRTQRRAGCRTLDAFARRSLWETGVWPRPAPEVLALAGQLDRLRREAPAWWRRVDEAP
jgi:hypothetical protein